MTIETSAAALIVRNIADIEAALALAHELDDQIWEGVGSFLKERLPASWHVSEFDTVAGHVWFAPPEWQTHENAETNANPYFTVEAIPGSNDEYDETYIASFLGLGPNGSAIAVCFASSELDKTRTRKALCNPTDARISTLLQAGVQLDAGSWLYLPVTLDSEQLSQAVQDEEYSEALEPLGNVLEILVAHVTTFAALVPQVGADQLVTPLSKV